VTMLATRAATDGDAIAESLRAAGVSVHQLDAAGKLYSSPALPGAVEQCLDAGVDVAHVHALWEDAQSFAARACRRRGVPYLVTPHGMLAPWSYARSRWQKRVFMAWRVRRMLNGAAAIHYTTEIERDQAARFRFASRPLVQTLGVDVAEFRDLPPLGEFRARYPQIGDRPIVLFLSRLHEQKGLPYLIDAFAEANVPEAMLVIAGPDFGRRDEADALVARRGLSARTIFTGMLEGRRRVEALRDADLFVLPSLHENFGMVVVEALAAGLPVIISNQVAIHPEIGRAGVGQVVPLSTPAVAAAIAQWMKDPAMRAEAAARARPYVWQEFDWDQIGRRWIEHYQLLRTTRS
jgi:glycosyltransferase involved in cell wall biosynthesis